ncbi:pol protein [Cucumis melo var. makuwa]|uniref:Pol protein n=1 Tax=Cucumis melo var. makuwa TaxID=1194695 RepID=A0A5A7U5R4_CUCMM|nr:pol protein [Cucumis melo var. makuwa]
MQGAKSYADVRRKDLEFNVGDKVFLKVAPMKGVLRFEKKGKLSSHFVGPFEILERICPVAYRLALPPSLSAIHDVFHVSMLRKYVIDPSHPQAPPRPSAYSSPPRQTASIPTLVSKLLLSKPPSSPRLSSSVGRVCPSPVASLPSLRPCKSPGRHPPLRVQFIGSRLS